MFMIRMTHRASLTNILRPIIILQDKLTVCQLYTRRIKLLCFEQNSF